VDRKLLRRAGLTWLLLLVAMFAAGAFRVAVVAPRLSLFGAEVAGALLGIAVILALTRPFLRSLHGPTPATLAGIGAFWLALTVAFEFGFFHYVGGRSWESLFEQYDVGKGHLWPFVLAAVAVAPFVWARRGPPAPGASRSLPRPGSDRSALG
jgi:hypothetical protein